MQLEDNYFFSDAGFIKGRFRDVNDMVAQVKPLLSEKSQPAYFFRGQIHPWRLRASIHRSPNVTEEAEKTARFVEWLKQNHYLCSEKVQPQYNEFLAVAQHYGYKTDLIDFTTDIEVAAFFATDFPSLDKLPEEKCGCLWCVSLDEISCMQSIFWDAVEKEIITEQQVIEQFRENKLSPFFQFDFPGLSRIKNQAGVFLWDIHGIFTSSYFDGPDILFNQTEPNAYMTERVNRQLIYPAPNALEREIERYIYPRNHFQTIQSSEYKELLAKCNVYRLQPVGDKYSDLANVLNEYIWEDEDWKSYNKSFYPNNEVYNTKICQLKDISSESIKKEHLIKMISDYKKNLVEGCILEFKCESTYLADIINEMIHTLYYYPYNDEQCAEALYYAMRYAETALRMFKDANGRPWHGELYSLSNNVPLDRVAEEVYGGSVVQVELGDEVGVSTRGFVCREYLQRIDKKDKDEQLKKAITYIKDNHMPLQDNFTLLELMRMVTNPRKLFDFDDICHIFVKYILPYQFTFRSNECRIYIPSLVTNFGYA